ncbi:MAG TPA: pilus assembly protein, partial [Planctomycetaceae bacterium]|nr:pilus assembly protein [Planctomycetaceae bacterium]
VFFAVVLGIIEFGRAMMVGQLVTNAAREATRRAVLNGATNQEIQQWVVDFLTNTINVDPADITVTITVTPAEGNPDPGNELGNAQTGDLCTVQVDVPFDAISFLPGNFLSGQQVLSAQSAMRHE